MSGKGGESEESKNIAESGVEWVNGMGGESEESKESKKSAFIGDSNKSNES